MSFPTSTHQFNLAVPDMKEVLAELKQNVDPPYPQQGKPTCVEISVETAEVSFLIECKFDT